MTARVTTVIDRRLLPEIRQRLRAFPVVVLSGARAVGKSTLLRQLATENNVTVVDLDDPSTLPLVTADPGAFVTGASPVCIDEFQHAPEVLSAIKAELNKDGTPGRYIITGSTSYEALPLTAQSLTGRATVVTVWPLSQSEVEGFDKNLVAELLDGTFEPSSAAGGVTERAEYVDRVLAGGFPQALALPDMMRPQWCKDYVSLVCSRDVLALSKIRQRELLPQLWAQLAQQTGQLLHMADAARTAGLDASTGENYTQLLESVFALYRVPAWGTSLTPKSGSLPKVHMVDTGVASNLLRLTADKLEQKRPAALKQFGHLLVTFVVNEIHKQAGFMTGPISFGHWRDRNGREVDLIVERSDGAAVGFEVKASSQIKAGDHASLAFVADRLGEAWLSGVVFYTGRHTAVLDAERRIYALPIDSLWSPR